MSAGKGSRPRPLSVSIDKFDQSFDMIFKASKQCGEYRYPTGSEIERDIAQETAAITTAVSAMADALENCPLTGSLRVYAAIELAFKYGDRKFVGEVFREVTLLMGGPDV